MRLTRLETRRALYETRAACLAREAERHFRAAIGLIGLGVGVTLFNAVFTDGECKRGLWPMFAAIVIWPEWRRRMRAVLTEHQDYIAWLKAQR